MVVLFVFIEEVYVHNGHMSRGADFFLHKSCSEPALASGISEFVPAEIGMDGRAGKPCCFHPVTNRGSTRLCDRSTKTRQSEIAKERVNDERDSSLSW